MKKQDALFQLIKSLTRGERRNFRMLTQLTSGDKKYLQLFDAVEQMDDYDETKLIKKFKDDSSFEKQLAYNKNYLYNAILNSLAYFRKGQDAERSSLTLQIRILLEKNLYTHAQKLLRKAKEKMLEQEKFEELLLIYQYENEILRRTEKLEVLRDALRQVDIEEKITFDKLLNLREYRRLETQTHVMTVTLHIARKETDLSIVDQLLSSYHLQDESNAMSNRARILYNEVRRRIEFYRGDHEVALAYAKKAVDMYDSAPSIKNEERLTFLRQVLWLAHHTTFVHGAESSLPYILKIRDTEVVTAQERAFRFEKYFLYLLAYFQDTGERATPGFLEEFDEELKRLVGELKDSSRLLVYFGRANYHFVHGEFSEALRWINQFLNHPRTNARTDLQASARLLNLLIHYELGNLDVIEYSLKSAYRFIYKQERMHKYERRFLSFFRRILAVPDEAARFEEIKSFDADLRVIVQDEFEKNALMFVKMEEWLESKITGQPMAEMLAERTTLKAGTKHKVDQQA